MTPRNNSGFNSKVAKIWRPKLQKSPVLTTPRSFEATIHITVHGNPIYPHEPYTVWKWSHWATNFHIELRKTHYLCSGCVTAVQCRPRSLIMGHIQRACKTFTSD